MTGNLNTGRTTHTATLLQNGMVLVAGGFDSTFNATASAELYDPASGTWTATGNLNNARVYDTATSLPSGMVLVAGGRGCPVYRPFRRPFLARKCTILRAGPGLPPAVLSNRRVAHTATLLPNGMVALLQRE